MKINKLHIGSFGKFKDYELELKDGFQIVYGRNEDGKSTLMAFIKMMFYGNLGKGKDIDKNLRAKYQPWDGSMISGAVEFEHGGIPYRLQKDLGPTPAKDKVTLINMGTGSTVPLGKNEEVGKRFFGLDLAGFERSFFIGQIGNFSSNGSSDEVGEKLLSNLVLSGEENVSQTLVIDRLGSAVEDMESKNHKKGILVEAVNELERLRKEKSEIEILEEDQKEYVKEYTQLQERIKDQKDIQNLLRLIADKNKFEKINELIEKITGYTEKAKELEIENIPYEKLRGFLGECNSLIGEIHQAKGALEKLKSTNGSGSNSEANLIPISEEEYKFLNELGNKESSLSELFRRLDENFIPSLKAYINAKDDYINAEEALKQEREIVGELEEFHGKFKRCEEEKAGKIEEKNSVARSYETDKTKWESDRELRQERIRSGEDKLSLLKQVREPGANRGKKQNPLLFVSLAVGIISIILSIAVHPAASAGVVVAIIMGIVAARGNKQGSAARKEGNHGSIKDREQEIKDLKDENEQKENEIKEKIRDYEGRLIEISKSIDGFEKEMEVLSEKNKAYEASFNRIGGLETKKEMAKSMYDMRLNAYKQEKSSLVDKNLNSPYLDTDMSITALMSEDLEEAEAREYRDKIEGICKTAGLEISEKLKEKSCASVEEYEKKYLKYASNSKNREVISKVEDDCTEKIRVLLSRVEEYKAVDNYDEARNLIEGLDKEICQVESDKTEALNIAKGMGYDSPSLDYLKEEAAKFEPSVEYLKENGKDDYSEEELLKKMKSFEEDKVEERYQEIREKIKTPEKNLSQIQEELEEKEKEVHEKTDYFSALKTALEVMQEASDEMHMSFGPELNKKTAGIFKSLTRGKYGNILVTKDYDISVQSGVHFREWKYLSNGTVDQAYLSLRLAITELISDKNTALPLFLDDVLMQYDDERTDAALNFISEYAKQKGKDFQLLLFTCHQHIVSHAEPYTDKVIKIS